MSGIDPYMLEKAADKNKFPSIDWSEFDVSTCTRCKLCSSRNNVLKPRLVPDSQILFVFGAPDQREDYTGEILAGESGQLLIKMLGQMGIDFYQCSFAHMVSCLPLNRKPPEKISVKACSDILDHYIEVCNPKVIVPLGNEALHRVAKIKGITRQNGLILDHPNYPNSKIIPIVDPIAAVKDIRNLSYIEQGLQRVKSHLEGKQTSRFSEVTYVDSIEQFDIMHKELSSAPYYAIDIECSGLRWIDAYIISIGFSCRAGHAYVLPWIVGDEAFYSACDKVLSTKKRSPIDNIKSFCELVGVQHPKFKWEGTYVKEKLKELFASQSQVKIFHNYTFDYKWLEAQGLKIEGAIYDTMIMHHLLDERKYKHGLDDCCLEYLKDYGQYWKGKDELLIGSEEKKDSFALLPLKLLSQYNGTDCDVTLQLFHLFYERMRTEDEAFLPLYNGFLMPLSQMLLETERNGVKVDVELLNKYEKILQDKLKEIDDQLLVLAPNINFNSSKQVGELFFQTLRLPTIKETDSGKQSVDEEVLERLSALHDIPKLLLTKRKLDKILSTYLLGVKAAMWPDGKVHANFKQTGTETGRLSSSDPNMQNIPRKPAPGTLLYDLGVNVKDIFIVSDDDYYLVETDYSQAELRLIAEYSRDDGLYSAFMEGRDPHAELAVHLYHKERVQDMINRIIRAEDIVTPEERQMGKTANFSLVYGKSAKNFAKENNIPLNEAIYIHTVYWQARPKVRSWQEREKLKAYQTGKFRSEFGRTRRLGKLYSNNEYIRAEAEREGLNHVIQAQASDYTLYSTMKVLAKCKELGLRARTVSFVHDSAVYQVHKADIQQFLTLLYDIMLHPPGITIPMESECKVGNRYGSLKQWIFTNGIWAEKPKKAA